MLNHLVATILICLGVANTTPISNYDQEKSNLVLTTPKKANENERQYTLTLQRTGRTGQVYDNENSNNEVYMTATLYESKQNYSAHNNNINVIGNAYISKLEKSVENSYVSFYMNPRVNLQNEDTLQNTSRIGYMFKINTYNYNEETTLKLRLYLDMRSVVINNNNYTFSSITMQRNVYTSTEYSWNGFLDRQIQKYQAFNIKSEIQDINNGYYYNKTTTEETITTSNITETYENEVELQIINNMDNFIYIEYLPKITPETHTGYEFISQTWFAYGEIDSVVDNTITGTYITPTQTYEVVDIPGIMFEVIGMPFAFVSQAFNLTLFPGTPYQINIANLFLSIAAIFVFVWLLLLFIKMKG